MDVTVNLSVVRALAEVQESHRGKCDEEAAFRSADSSSSVSSCLANLESRLNDLGINTVKGLLRAFTR